MRSSDAKVGETYALCGRPTTKLVKLETPPEVSRRKRMRVRFQTGVKAGEEAELPSRSIVPLPGSEGPKHKSRSVLTPQRDEDVSLPLTVGASVVLASDQAGFIWTVVRLESDHRAEIVTTIFESETRRRVEQDELVVVGPREETAALHFSYSLRGRDYEENRFSEAHWAATNLRPEHPKRELDLVLDSLIFSPRCVQSYRDRLAPNLSISESNERLRRRSDDAASLIVRNAAGSTLASVCRIASKSLSALALSRG
jgi:hypothetical protein